MKSLPDCWGTTEDETRLEYRCDALITTIDTELFRAVGIDAPASTVFRWLCQLKLAPYSYDWIDNFGRQSPQTLTPGAENLEKGQRVMTIFRLVDFEKDRHITLAMDIPWAKRFLGETSVTYMVVPQRQEEGGGCRLLAKLCIMYPAAFFKGVLGFPFRLFLSWGDLIMMRKQLLNLKELSEKTVQNGK